MRKVDFQILRKNMQAYIQSYKSLLSSLEVNYDRVQVWMEKIVYKLKSYSLPLLEINKLIFFIFLSYLCFHDAIPNAFGASYYVEILAIYVLYMICIRN